MRQQPPRQQRLRLQRLRRQNNKQKLTIANNQQNPDSSWCRSALLLELAISRLLHAQSIVACWHF